MSINNQILAFSSEKPAQQPVILPGTVEAACRLFIDSLHTNLVQMFAQADDFFFDMTENGYNNANFDAMRILRVQKNVLISQFKSEFQQGFKTKINTDPQAQGSDESWDNEISDGLSLIKDSELEEGIAIDEMVRKAINDNNEQLNAITMRLDHQITERSITLSNNPFSPNYICATFKKTATSLELDLKQLLIIYKLFQRTVLAGLEDNYQNINQYFVNQNILPELKKFRPRRNNKYNNQSSSNSVQELEQSENENEVSDQQFLSVMRELLSAKSNYSVPANPNSPQIETPELVSSLTNLQTSQSLNSDNNGNLAANLQQLIVQNLNKNTSINTESINKASLNQFSSDMIDIVSMLFDFILDDRNLHSEIKAIISRLQIPMLKVCLVDKSFFSNKKHSAKLLLNEIAKVGISWDPNNNDAELVLLEIQRIVDKVNDEFKDDIGLFDDILTDFRAFIASNKQRADIFERRTKEAEEGKAKTESARSIVNQELQKICQTERIPEAVRKILKNVWVHVMLLKRLYTSDQGWQQACKIAKLLVWSVQPKSNQEELKKLTNIVSSLVKNLKKGFAIISVSPIDEAHMLYQLEEEHRKIIQQSKELIEMSLNDEIIRLSPKPVKYKPQQQVQSNHIKPETTAKPKSSNIIEIHDIGFTVAQTGINKPKKELTQISKDSLQAIEALTSGQWIDLTIENKRQRCKLAAILAAGERLVFVNRTGAKAAVLSKLEAAEKYQSNKLKILDDNALFDRAMESVIVSLRSLKPAKATV
jgi:hypothetical protein